MESFPNVSIHKNQTIDTSYTKFQSFVYYFALIVFLTTFIGGLTGNILIFCTTIRKKACPAYTYMGFIAASDTVVIIWNV